MITLPSKKRKRRSLYSRANDEKRDLKCEVRNISKAMQLPLARPPLPPSLASTGTVNSVTTPLSVLFGASSALTSQAARSQFKAQKLLEFVKMKHDTESINLQATRSLTFSLEEGTKKMDHSVNAAAACFHAQGVAVLTGGSAQSQSLLPRALLRELKIAAEAVKQRVCSRLQQLGIPFETAAMHIMPGVAEAAAAVPFVSRAEKLQQAQEALDREARGCFRFQEASSRCLGRIDVSLVGSLASHPFNSTALTRHPGITRVVESFLGEDCVLSFVGLVLSFPGAASQPFHEDGAPLFFRGYSSAAAATPPCYAHSAVQCPPHAINVFIPLQRVTEAVGPTEFFPASHVLENRQLLDSRLQSGAGAACSVVYSPQLQQKARGEDDSECFYRPRMEGAVGPLLAEGSALLYDYRVSSTAAVLSRTPSLRHFFHLFSFFVSRAGGAPWHL